ncbi:hypothetical protein ACFW03_29125 [Peribacillus butanolivorans]|uniref:hypothetical protein n=2 Tax=Bacillati TaxID=1783272 RepID=UPI0036BC1116
MEELIAAYIAQLSEKDGREYRARGDLLDEVYRYILGQGFGKISISVLTRVVDQYVRLAILEDRAARVGSGEYVFSAAADIENIKRDYDDRRRGLVHREVVSRSVPDRGPSLEERLNMLTARNNELSVQIDRMRDLLRMKGGVLALILDDDFLCTSASARKSLFDAQDYAL